MHSADLLTLDAQGHPFLWLEAKSSPISPDLQDDLLREMWSEREAFPYGRSIRFGLLVDPHEIRLFALDQDPPSRPIGSWSTKAVLTHYDPGIERYTTSKPDLDVRDSNFQKVLLDIRSRNFAPSLAQLTGSWLRDLADRWKTQFPPGMDQWEGLGLLPLLRETTTRSEVPLGFDSVR